jgi:hypothetical protein
MKGHTMIEKKITFYGGNFELIRAIDITRPVPECWVPPSEFDACNAIQATSNGIVIGPEFSRIFAEIILQSVDAERLLIDLFRS